MISAPGGGYRQVRLEGRHAMGVTGGSMRMVGGGWVKTMGTRLHRRQL